MALSNKQKQQRWARVAETARVSLALVGVTMFAWLAQLIDQLCSTGS